MFKNDRMMMILTGLVLAIFAGTMVKYGDRIIGLMSGEAEVASQDDSYSVRAGSEQILDVLSNDTVKGPIVVLTRPGCGSVELTGNNKLSFLSNGDCTGEIEFAYCVDNEGACVPNAVKINVISINYAQVPTGTPAPQPTQTPQNGRAPPIATAQSDTALPSSPPSNLAPENPPVADIPVAETVVARAPEPVVDQAPQIETISTTMAPPALATPSIPELISPSIAVASIRQSAGGLNRAANTDQNIAAQNSAGVARASTVASASFAAPSVGETSNISLGSAPRSTVASVAAPSGLQSAQSGGTNITQLERGPVALAALQNGRATLAPQESAPLTTNPERTSFAPVEVAVAQTATPTPDQKFSAAPHDGGPIALVALQSPRRDGNAAGESLNVFLSEPGVQLFAKAQVPPSALAPASAGFSAVTVLERGPALLKKLLPPRAPAPNNEAAIYVARNRDADIRQSPLAALPAAGAGTGGFMAAAPVLAALPNQIRIPKQLFMYGSASRFVSVTYRRDGDGRAMPPATLAPLTGLALHLPAISLTPAEKPVILQASLPTTPVAPVITAPIQNSNCAILLDARTRNGAMIELSINAGCKAAQMVTIEHGGISFSVLTDAAGTASVSLPAMEETAEVTVRFEDQSSATTQIEVRDIAGVIRAGVSWQSGMDLDLNAYEYGAAVGTEGHVSPQSPRDYRTSRIKGGGYLLQLGDPTLARGALAEVYTIPVNRNQQRGTVAMSILISNTGAVCGQSISAKTSRTREGRSAGVRNVRFTVPDCGTVAAQITLPGAIDDIRLAGR